MPTVLMRTSRSLLAALSGVSLLGCGVEPEADLTTAAEALKLPQAGRCFGKADADAFGGAMAHGDFDGDGDLDLAIAAPTDEQHTLGRPGAVYVYRRSPNGLAPWRRLTAEGIGLGGPQRPGFGTTLAAADFDGDGQAELAIGRPDGAGIVAIVGLGSDDEFVKEQQLMLWSPVITGGAGFGSSLAVGDFDGDQRPDLAIGAPGDRGEADVRIGRVYVARGGSAGLTNWLIRSASMIGAAAEVNGRFGTAIAAGDFDGNGLDDLAVGSPLESNAQGALYLLRSTSQPLQVTNRFWGQVYVTQGSSRTFGSVLTVGDFDGSGRDDLAVGVPSASSSAGARTGATVVFRGNATTLAHWTTLQFPYGAAEQGRWLTTGDFDGNGAADLAIGQLAAGAVGELQIFRGRVGNTLLLGKAYAETALLGASTADTNGDGKAELYVGHADSKVLVGTGSAVYMPSFTSSVVEQATLCTRYWGTAPTLALVTRGATTLQLEAVSSEDFVRLSIEELESGQVQRGTASPFRTWFQFLDEEETHCYAAAVLVTGSDATSDASTGCFDTLPAYPEPALAMVSRTATTLTVRAASSVAGVTDIYLGFADQSWSSVAGAEVTRTFTGLESGMSYCFEAKAEIDAQMESTPTAHRCFSTVPPAPQWEYGDTEVTLYGYAQGGTVAFGGTWGPITNARPYEIELDEALEDYALAFIKAGAEDANGNPIICATATAEHVVTVEDGDTLSAAQIEQIFPGRPDGVRYEFNVCRLQSDLTQHESVNFLLRWERPL